MPSRLSFYISSWVSEMTRCEMSPSLCAPAQCIIFFLIKTIRLDPIAVSSVLIHNPSSNERVHRICCPMQCSSRYFNLNKIMILKIVLKKISKIIYAGFGDRWMDFFCSSSYSTIHHSSLFILFLQFCSSSFDPPVYFVFLFCFGYLNRDGSFGYCIFTFCHT